MSSSFRRRKPRPVEWTRTNPELWAMVPTDIPYIGAHCARCGYYLVTYKATDGHNRTVGHGPECPSPQENWSSSHLGGVVAQPHSGCSCPDGG